jgi:hypothetical protein
LFAVLRFSEAADYSKNWGGKRRVSSWQAAMTDKKAAAVGCRDGRSADLQAY